MLLLLHIIVTYIKVNIITKLQKLYSLPRNPRVGNKLPVLFVEKPLCMGDLSPACKIFIERPVTSSNAWLTPCKYIVKGNIAVICAKVNHNNNLAKLITAIYEIKNIASQRMITITRCHNSKRFSLALTSRMYNTVTGCIVPHTFL